MSVVCSAYAFSEQVTMASGQQARLMVTLVGCVGAVKDTLPSTPAPLAYSCCAVCRPFVRSLGVWQRCLLTQGTPPTWELALPPSMRGLAGSPAWAPPREKAASPLWGRSHHLEGTSLTLSHLQLWVLSR